MESYSQYQKLMEELYYLDSTIANLQWDQEVMLPARSAEFRSKQIAYLSSLSHKKFIDESTGKLIEQTLQIDLTPDQKVNVSKTLYDYKMAILLPSSFVEKRSELTSKAYTAWMKARNSSNASIFLESFKPLLDLKRQEAKLRGYEKHPYDALLNVYDKGLDVETLDPLFSQLDKNLEELIAWVKGKQKNLSDILEVAIPEKTQWDFSIELLQAINFDFERGRQDISEHPFTIALAPHDIRLTTHSSNSHISPIIWGSIHEAGHALYEQGLPKTTYQGLPLSQAASLPIHESQARFWEIQIGKSDSFWKYFYPKLRESYNLKNNRNEFMKAIHHIVPNRIRTEADELHYHRHIIIRYELEKKLMSGTLEVENLESEWNEMYSQRMGLEIRNPVEGILQDIHWAHGGLGYFPTYTLGSIYAAELYSQIKNELADFHDEIENGKFNSINEWLKDNIYQHGRKYDSQSLMKNILNRDPSSDSLVQIFKDKLEKLYQG